MDNLFCKIFVYNDFSINHLRDTLSAHYGVQSGSKEIVIGIAEISILKNTDYDASRPADFPDGFMFFPFLIEVTFSEHDQLLAISTISELLSHLWDIGIAAIASCDYESFLPHQGGYNSNEVPWPGK